LGGGHGHPVVVGEDPRQVGAEVPGGRQVDGVRDLSSTGNIVPAASRTRSLILTKSMRART
jgi:hypothetical protein